MELFEIYNLRLMSTFKFLTENYNEGPTTYYAISEDRIEPINYSDTYDGYGQKVSSSDAGDYLYLDTDKAVEVANRCANKYEEYEEVSADYSIGAYISAYDERALYDDILDAYNVYELTDSDIQINKSTVEGFNFWNGHNWRTITTGVGGYGPTHIVVSDETLIKELQEAVDNMKFTKHLPGLKIYSYGKYRIVESCFQASWAFYEIFLANEAENGGPVSEYGEATFTGKGSNNDEMPY